MVKISVLKLSVPYQPEMKDGFMAYQIMGQGKWRYSAFETISSIDGLKVSMTSFKGNGYGHFYASSVYCNANYKVFPTLETAQRFCEILNSCAKSRREDERYIASGGRYM